MHFPYGKHLYFFGEQSDLGGETDGVADAGNGLPLEGGGGGEQGPRGREEHPPPFPRPQARQHIPVQHSGGAAAAGGAGVHVLGLPVIQQQSAVLVTVTQVDAVPLEKVPYDVVAQLSQVTGEDEVVILRPGLRIPEKGGQGVVGGGGRSQGCTMWKMFSVKFNAYSSPEARRF